MVVDALHDSKRLGFSALTDEQVVERVLKGETGLFEILMRRHNQRLFRAARAIVRDDAEAEDVIQETYVRAYAQLSQFEHRATWATWVTRIAVHEALARVRRRGRFVETDIDRMEEGRMESARGSSAQREEVRNAGAEPGPEDQALGREMVGFLERAVDALPDIYRTVFMLRGVEGLSSADTASSLQISEDLVKVRLHRARAELRRALEARLGTARDLFPFYLARCDRVVQAVLARVGSDPG